MNRLRAEVIVWAVMSVCAGILWLSSEFKPHKEFFFAASVIFCSWTMLVSTKKVSSDFLGDILGIRFKN